MISEIEQELFTVEQSQLKILGENTFQENLLKKNKIVAKSDGILHIEPNIVKSNIIPKGTPIVKILPEIGKVKKIKIKFYVLSKDISNLEIGDDLKFYIHVSSNKKVELHSKITEIDSSATETKQGNLFKISSEYVINDSMAKNIRYGMSGNIVIITGKKTYLDYYINKLITNT
ncbi:transport protein ComB [Streptococcus pseudoporcinus]|uniref:Transport protein ComB n=1 Tax=Streptococcus pseudoporcinus TaxID=361101 RepID=A0A4U9Z6B2_9STRE|nr:HlyD family efflux transporter periplasmic adaptor subunit [Streptococcus pseudoporcinus]VTS35232.1 transport protein ComB [Streptococcus pseudoporcinus]